MALYWAKQASKESGVNAPPASGIEASLSTDPDQIPTSTELDSTYATLSIVVKKHRERVAPVRLSRLSLRLPRGNSANTLTESPWTIRTHYGTHSGTHSEASVNTSNPAFAEIDFDFGKVVDLGNDSQFVSLVVSMIEINQTEGDVPLLLTVTTDDGEYVMEFTVRKEDSGFYFRNFRAEHAMVGHGEKAVLFWEALGYQTEFFLSRDGQPEIQVYGARHEVPGITNHTVFQLRAVTQKNGSAAEYYQNLTVLCAEPAMSVRTLQARLAVSAPALNVDDIFSLDNDTIAVYSPMSNDEISTSMLRVGQILPLPTSNLIVLGSEQSLSHLKVVSNTVFVADDVSVTSDTVHMAATDLSFSSTSTKFTSAEMVVEGDAKFSGPWVSFDSKVEFLGPSVFVHGELESGDGYGKDHEWTKFEEVFGFGTPGAISQVQIAFDRSGVLFFQPLAKEAIFGSPRLDIYLSTVYWAGRLYPGLAGVSVPLRQNETVRIALTFDAKAGIGRLPMVAEFRTDGSTAAVVSKRDVII